MQPGTVLVASLAGGVPEPRVLGGSRLSANHRIAGWFRCRYLIRNLLAQAALRKVDVINFEREIVP